MEIEKIDGKPFLCLSVDNITQPGLSVSLRILTPQDPVSLEKARKIAHYMAEQSKMLIPFFYELRNEMPRGRVQQMMDRRAKSLSDVVCAGVYHDLVSADEFEFSAHVPLRTITVEGSKVHVRFACEHDPDFSFFEKTMEIPFHKPQMWAEVEAYEQVRLAEIALALEKKMGKHSGDDEECDAEDSPQYPEHSREADLYSMAS